MVNSTVRMLASDISHMPLNFVWRDSGVTQEHGFELVVDIASVKMEGQPFITMESRAPSVLDGTYDFLSGLHHETYHYRARGDKRFVYLAQAQNDWDDVVVVRPEIKSLKDLEGKKFLVTARAPCVYGNLVHSLELGGVDVSRIEFVDADRAGGKGFGPAIDTLVRGDVSAASIDVPFDLQGVKRGMRRLEIPSVPVIHNATMCANNDWVKANQETTLAFLRSMIDAIHFFKTEKSKVCEILERNLAPLMNITERDEIEYLHEVWAKLLSPKPYPHPLAVWNVYNLDVAHDPEVNFIGPFEIWDTSYLREIDDSGYIDEMYGGAEAVRNPAVNVAI